MNIWREQNKERSFFASVSKHKKNIYKKQTYYKPYAIQYLTQPKDRNDPKIFESIFHNGLKPRP